MISLKYKNVYEEFINKYKEIHVNPFHEISEEELTNIYDKLVNEMDISDIYSFTYFINYIIKRLSGLSDAHTMFRLHCVLPINFKILDNDILVNYPSELKGYKLISINDINIDIILKELDYIITYGTQGKKRKELENSLFDFLILKGLPSLRNKDNLVYKFQNIKTNDIIEKQYSDKIDYSSELFDYEKYFYGDPEKYEFINNNLIIYHSSVQKDYEEIIKNRIDELNNQDLSNVDKIIIDLRGNIGGNSGLNRYLIEFLKKNSDKELIVLTDYRIFSAGRYALNDLINLGCTTIGEEISTPINCYGETKWINIDKYYDFSISKKYFNPSLNIGINTKEEFINADKNIFNPIIFKPDIEVKQNKNDYLNNIDTILEYALNYSKRKVK